MMTYGTPKWREWVLDEATSFPLIRQAVEAGINFFDTADVYSIGVSEEVTGRALKTLFQRRDEYVLATKVFNTMGSAPNQRGLSRKHIMEGIDASLNDVVRAGKALYIGASSMYAWQFAKALAISEKHNWSRFVSMQDHYNLVYREEEREMIPLCESEGIAVIPWSPLARGFLAGNRNTSPHEGETVRAKTDDFAHRMYYQQSDFTVLDRVTDLAGKHGVKPAQIALAWMLHRPAITAPIIGVSKAYQLDEAIGAMSIKLSTEEIAHLEEAYTPHPILGH
jgi:aryl-alcohol dehydrogenase (NADP+)